MKWVKCIQAHVFQQTRVKHHEDYFRLYVPYFFIANTRTIITFIVRKDLDVAD